MSEATIRKLDYIQCDAVFVHSMHKYGEQCKANGIYGFEGKNYCKRHAKEEAFNRIFKGKD